MSLQARQTLVRHPHTLFRRQSQRDDLLDPDKTSTDLVALLLYLVGKGHILEFTAIRSDHHDDSCLGFHSHGNGYASDVWFNKTATLGDYLDASDPQFTQGLADAARCVWLYQVGLAAEADTGANEVAAGRTEFTDGGASHVHLGAEDAA